MASIPRGVRNHNPGNIDRHAETKWQGAADDQWHGHCTGIHHQHMLQAQRGKFAGGKYFVDGVNSPTGAEGR